MILVNKQFCGPLNGEINTFQHPIIMFTGVCFLTIGVLIEFAGKLQKGEKVLGHIHGVSG